MLAVLRQREHLTVSGSIDVWSGGVRDPEEPESEEPESDGVGLEASLGVCKGTGAGLANCCVDICSSQWASDCKQGLRATATSL